MDFMYKQYLRKFFMKKVFFLLVALGIIIYFGSFLLRNPFADYDRITIRHLIDDAIWSQNHKGCQQPDLPVFSPEIMKFVKDVPEINCNKAEKNWVSCANFECHILPSIIIEKGKVQCSFTDILRTGDSDWSYGETTNSDSMYRMENSDVVKVECYSSYGHKWKGVLTTTRYDQSIFDRSGWEFTPSDSLKLNVLIFAIDSISRNTMIRKLPKTYKFLTEKLGAHILEGYNIIGDGTPQALTPMLTGKTELELPETRKRMKNAHFVDVYPFIWKDFQQNGYVTGYLEEGAEIGTYTYRLKGFNKQPTDHYMRNYYLAASDFHKKSPKYCAGSVPKHKVMLDFVVDFYRVYKDRPTFMFAFQADLSHDNYNLVGAADDSYVNFLKSLQDMGVFNNTLFIAMADHGHRFAAIRNTLQGKLEERLPFYSFSFPAWFKHKYPELYTNFLNNMQTLVTPFDIYPTLKTVLNPKEIENNLVPVGRPRRSLSLFGHIRKNRSCTDAYIEPHWCACLDWQKMNISDAMSQKVAARFLDYLNQLMSTNAPGQCAQLQLDQIFWIQKLVANENLIKFKQAQDHDGFVPDLSGSTRITSVLYQIKLRSEPGGGIFEATLSHLLATDEIVIKEEDISRINMYGTQPDCIATSFPNLRKFCFCNDQPKFSK